jgi:hypothetical protein
MVTTAYPTTEEARQEAEKLLRKLLAQGYSITSLHIYTDKAGSPHWRVRLDHPEKEKEIRPISFINGKWELKEPKFPDGKPLYNLNEILKRPDETVWIVEGEKCADALMILRILATTSGGATSAEEADWSPLYNRHITVWPDNDEPGIEYARIILIILINKILTSEIVNLDKLNLPEKGDCIDWLRMSNNKQEDWDSIHLLDAKSFEWAYGQWGDLNLPKHQPHEISSSVLPSPYGEYAEALAQSMEVPEGLAVFGVLGAVSSAIGHRIKVSPKKGWEEPSNLYLLAILPPGNNKSAALKACTFPLTEWEKTQAELLGPEIRKAQSERKNREELIKRKRTEAIRQNDHDLQKLEFQEIAEMEASLKEVLPLPQVFITDATPESLAKSVCEQKGRFAVISDEGEIMDVLAGLYTKGQSNLNIVLNGIDGGHVRIKRQEASIDINPILTFCLFAQPAVLQNMAHQKTFMGKGFLERFLYLIPETKLGYRTHDTTPVADEIRSAYARELTILLDIGLDPKLEPSKHWVFTLSSESLTVFKQFQLDIEKELRPSGKLYPVRGWGGKVCGYLLRIAGLLQTMEYGTAKKEMPVSIMNNALQLVKLLIDHALVAFDSMGADQASEDAKVVLNWIKENDQFAFKKNDCHRALGGHFKKAGELEEVLDSLQALGFVSAPIDVRTGGRGRPSIVHRVNPKIFSDQTWSGFSKN